MHECNYNKENLVELHCNVTNVNFVLIAEKNKFTMPIDNLIVLNA